MHFRDIAAYFLSAAVPVEPVATLPRLTPLPMQPMRRTLNSRAYKDRSRYRPHQGAKERARRAKRAA